MAAIDKIYCDSKERFLEFYKWCEQHQKECYRETGIKLTTYFYVTPDKFDNNTPKAIPITNFPVKADQWILENCKIEWIVKYIKNQHQIG